MGKAGADYEVTAARMDVLETPLGWGVASSDSRYIGDKLRTVPLKISHKMRFTYILIVTKDSDKTCGRPPPKSGVRIACNPPYKMFSINTVDAHLLWLSTQPWCQTKISSPGANKKVKV